MAGYSVNGVDLDSLLDPIGNSTPGANTGYTIQGNDLGSVYAPASAGAAYGTTNFFSTSLGSDLGQLFAAAGTVNVPATDALTVFGFGTVSITADQFSAVQVPTIPADSAQSLGANIIILTDTTGNVYNYGVIYGNSLTANVGAFQGFTSYNLSNTSTIPNPYPIQIPNIAISTGSNTTYKKYSTGYYSTLLIDANNKLFAWGDGKDGVLGTGSTAWASSPVQVGSSSWTMVSCGGNFNVAFTGAIRSDGTLWAWGNNTQGQLGLGNITSQSSPVQIGSANDWEIVATGLQNMAAIDGNRQLYTWGIGTSGVLGDGTTTAKSSPVQISGDWVDIGIGTNYMVGVKLDGTLWAWGLNSSGQLGLGDTTNRSSPVQIGTANNWVRSNNDKTVCIRAWTANSTYVVDNNNDLYVSGFNTNYQLGTGANTNLSLPSLVASNVKYLTGSAQFSMYTDINNNIFIAGNVANGLNMNSITGSVTASSYTQVVPNAVAQLRQLTRVFDDFVPTVTWKNLAMNGAANSTISTHGIKQDNTLWNYGYNGLGQLGDGTTTNRSSFTQLGTDSWTMVTASSVGSIFAIRDDFTLWAWGNNASGQLGDGTITNTSSPIQIGSSSWLMVSAGLSTTYAIRSDRTLWAWGWGGFGALGNGSTANQSSPVQIGSEYWQYVTARGTMGAFAIRMDSLLFGWGIGTSGSIGVGNTLTYSSPVQIGTELWKYVSSKKLSTFGIKQDNTLWAWGQNTQGTLGDSTLVNKSSPVQIGASSWIAVAGTDQGTIGIKSDNTLWAWGNGAGTTTTNVFGLGGGYFIRTSSPVQIGFNNTNQQGNLYTKLSLEANANSALFVFSTTAGS